MDTIIAHIGLDGAKLMIMKTPNFSCRVLSILFVIFYFDFLFVIKCQFRLICFIISASVVVSALMDIAFKKETRKLDHLRLLVTGQLDSLKLICCKEEDTDTAVQLLSAAVIHHSVYIQCTNFCFAY